MSRETRGILTDVQLREIDRESRSATFVAATENGVDTPFGVEVLKMDGLRLERYRKNPVVVDAHNVYETGAVIGRAALKTEGSKLIATIKFAETPRADEIWTLVRDGFVRMLSIGYRVMKRKEIMDGEVEGHVRGPATIATDWELYEVSTVPVGADADAVRRSFFLKEDPIMADESHDDIAKRARAAANILATRAMTIRAMAPRGLEWLADQLILDDRLSVDDVRAQLLDGHAKRMRPVGTPDPRNGADKQTQKPQLTADILYRSIVGM